MSFNIHPEIIEFISLFSGIGGLDKGLEDAGMRCVAQVENNEFCQKVLTKHWPDVPKYGDIRDVGRKNLSKADLIAGGFPCQPFSVAGKRRGTQDDRHLWPEMLRVIRELRPTWVLGENVPGIIKIFLDQAIIDLEGEGYTVESFVLPAVAFDAQHRRDRLFVVAYSEEMRPRGRDSKGYSGRRQTIFQGEQEGREMGLQIEGCNESLSDTYCGRRSSFINPRDSEKEAGRRQGDIEQVCAGEDVPNSESDLRGTSGHEGQITPYGCCSNGRNYWAIEPGVGRVADGIPDRVDRLKSLGNAVVPQVAEFIGRIIMEAHYGRS